MSARRKQRNAAKQANKLENRIKAAGDEAFARSYYAMVARERDEELKALDRANACDCASCDPNSPIDGQVSQSQWDALMAMADDAADIAF